MASYLMTSAEDIIFTPTKERLVGHYLPHKIRGNDSLVSEIAEIDYICNYEPWDLPFLAAIPSKDTWHFFSRPDRKYGKHGNINRVTKAGFWKVCSYELQIKNGANQVIGFMRRLVFYRGRGRNKESTNWTINEFYLKPSNSNGDDYVISLLHRKPPKKTVNLEVDEVDPGHYSASEVENPVIDISSPVVHPQFMAGFLESNGQDFTSSIALQPVMHMSQGPSYVNLQHTNGVTDDYTRLLSQFGTIDQQDNNTEAVKFYPADVHLYCRSHAASDESCPSESFSSLRIEDILAADGCLPEMNMMQGLSYENLQQTNCIADECNFMLPEFGTAAQQDDILEVKSYPAFQDLHSYWGSMLIAPSVSSPSELSGSLPVEDISDTEAVNALFPCFEAAPGVDNDWLWDRSFELASAYFS